MQTPQILPELQVDYSGLVESFTEINSPCDKIVLYNKFIKKFEQINSELPNFMKLMNASNLEKNYSDFINNTSQCDLLIQKITPKFKIGKSEELDFLIEDIKATLRMYFKTKSSVCIEFQRYWAQNLSKLVPIIDTGFQTCYDEISEKIQGLCIVNDGKVINALEVLINLNKINDQLRIIDGSLKELKQRLELAHKGIFLEGLDRKFESIQLFEHDLQKLSENCEKMQNSAAECQIESSHDCLNVFPLPFIDENIDTDNDTLKLFKDSEILIEFCKKHQDRPKTILLSFYMTIHRMKQLRSFYETLDIEFKTRYKNLVNSYNQIKNTFPEFCEFPRFLDLNNPLIKGTIVIESYNDFIKLFRAYDNCNHSFFNIRCKAASVISVIQSIRNTNLDKKF